MNYIVVSPLNYTHTTTDVAEWIYKHTQNKPSLIQYNGFANIMPVESYVTADAIIYPILLANSIINNKYNKKLYINRFCRVFTPYNSNYNEVIEYYNNELFVPNIESIFTNSQSFLDIARYNAPKNKDLEESFLNSINIIKDYVVLEKDYNNSICINKDYDNIYLCNGALINDSQRGLFPSSKNINIDIVDNHKESAEVCLVLDYNEQTNCNLDILNRVIDRHYLDNRYNYKYHIVIANFNNLKTIQISDKYSDFSLSKLIHFIRMSLYIDIETVRLYENNQLSNDKL